ncbi:MAG: cysteine desulfurase [Ignavibacteriae bacterium]|nr:cysteine desulfurase [Ignavibacteriota bacterium]
MDNIYLDNAASTATDERVLEAMMPFFTKNGNASSIHSFGKPFKVILEDSRDNIADFLGVKSKEVFFTSGGTESNNTVIKGICLKNLNGKRKHIISSSIEHPAVLDTLKYVEEKFGYEITLIKPGADGVVNSEEVLNSIKENTLLISLMHSNNETGIINNIEVISKNKGDILLHSDTVQSIGKVRLNLKNPFLDFASISGHKFYGPKGIGVLYINENVKTDKFIHGGGQERNIRGGTENIPAIAGLSKAFDLLRDEMDMDIEHYRNLKNYFSKKIREFYGDKVIFNSKEGSSLDNIINISFDTEKFDTPGDMLLIKLDLKGIAISGGSACSSGSLKPSRILLEMGRSERTAKASLRISFGRKNNIAEVNYLLETLRELVLEK